MKPNQKEQSMCINNPTTEQKTCQAKAPKALFQKILVAVDQSQQAMWAVQTAGEMARTTGATVALVHAYRVDAQYTVEMATPIEDRIAELREAGQELLHRLSKLLPAELEVTELLSDGEAFQQIVTAAEKWGAQLIVMGTHGRGRIAHFLLGSTAESVIRMARCPVLTVAHEPAKSVACRCNAIKARVAEVVEADV
jgi:nucleotide-binding universal stress UspA family protein